MRHNLHEADRSIRMVAGFILLVIGIWNLNLLALIGSILLATALAGICPLYSIFRIHTDRREGSRALDHGSAAPQH